jgi:protein tyrosine/serine phosphatase
MQIPEAFAIVEKDVYRSATLSSNTFFRPLKTILLLSPESPTKSLSVYVAEQKINLIHLGIQQINVNSWRPVSDELIKEGLEVILNTANHPVLVMDTSGVHETGALIGCLRKIQGWNFNSIIVEVFYFL